MQDSIIVENIKCGGCANSIKTELSKLVDITNIDVDIENGTIKYEHSEAFEKEILVSKLSKMGYPPQGEGNMAQKAKSYVSCMIGRVTSD